MSAQMRSGPGRVALGRRAGRAAVGVRAEKGSASQPVTRGPLNEVIDKDRRHDAHGEDPEPGHDRHGARHAWGHALQTVEMDNVDRQMGHVGGVGHLPR